MSPFLGEALRPTWSLGLERDLDDQGVGGGVGVVGPEGNGVGAGGGVAREPGERVAGGAAEGGAFEYGVAGDGGVAQACGEGADERGAGGDC